MNAGATLSAPATPPTRAEYTFDGWYKEPDCVNAWDFSSDTVTDNITLYAKWTPNSEPTPTPSPTPTDLDPIPQAGDNNLGFIWWLLLCVSAIGITALMLTGRKSFKNR